jgi:hypothetical protein
MVRYTMVAMTVLKIPFARKYGINQLMMGMMVVHGALAGAFSPISVYGAFINHGHREERAEGDEHRRKSEKDPGSCRDPAADHAQVLAFVAAFAVGVPVAGMTSDDVMAGFPGELFLVLMGLTFLTGEPGHDVVGSHASHRNTHGKSRDEGEHAHVHGTLLQYANPGSSHSCRSGPHLS